MELFILKKYMLFNWRGFKTIDYSVMNKLHNKYNLNTCIDLKNSMSFQTVL